MIFFTHGSLPVKSGFLHLLANLAIAAIENCLLTIDFPLRDADFPMGVYQKSLVISQLLTLLAAAAIENGLLTVDFLLRDGGFLYP